MLVSGEVGLGTVEYLNLSSEGALLGLQEYDSKNKKIYAFNYRPLSVGSTPNFNTNRPFIVKLGLDLSYNASTDKFTLPVGHAPTSNFINGLKLSDDNNTILIPNIYVDDTVSGETNPDGYSYKMVRIDVNHLNFSLSTISYYSEMNVDFGTGIFSFIDYNKVDGTILQLTSTDTSSGLIDLNEINLSTGVISVKANIPAGLCSDSIKLNSAEYILINHTKVGSDFFIKLIKVNIVTGSYATSNNSIELRLASTSINDLSGGVFILTGLDQATNILKKYTVDFNLNVFEYAESEVSNTLFDPVVPIIYRNIIINQAIYVVNRGYCSKNSLGQTTKNKPIVSGEVVGNAQTTKNKPFR